MEKTNIAIALVTLHGHYMYAENKDEARLARIAAHIDKLTDELCPPIAGTDTKKQEPAKNDPKPNLVDKNTPGASSQQKKVEPAKKPEEKKVEVKETAKEEKSEEEDTLVEVYPFYPCSVVPKGEKHAKPVNIKATNSFKAFTTDEAAKQANGAYPTVDLLELVFDAVWDAMCAGEGNKAVLDNIVKKELKGYYPEMKSDSDWYAKLLNPMQGMINFMKKKFGYAANDKTVQMTRPNEEDLELTHETDVTILKAAEPEKKEAPKAPEKPVEKKAEMKTVQKGKETPKAEPVKDEEVQENELNDEVDVDVEPEAEEGNDGPPEISDFSELNNFEKLLLNKILAGARAAAKVSDENSKKAIKTENREAVRNLIASNFEGQKWVEKVDGKWSDELIGYHNDFITTMNENKDKWPK